MKTLRFVITLACALMLSAALFATGVNTSWITFTQPDGTTFMGRTVGDEFESFSETQDGYRFVRNYENKYYYYAVLANPGDYTPSRFRVGIDKPEGIPRHLERTAERKRVLAAKRARFERELDVVRADTRAMAASVTYTLKVLLVEFQDVKHRNPSQDGKPAYTFQNFEDLFFSSGTYTSSSPDGEQVFGSMRDYYTQMSAGNFTLSGNVLNRDDDSDNVPDWLVLDYNKSAYTGSRNVRTDALNKASAAGLNTSTNSTTKLVVVYAGNIWLAGSLWPSAGSTQYVTCERFHWNDRGTDPTDAPFSHIGIHAHEFGHLLGFTDLYTTINGA
ncbi:MAG: immune inhibitor A domain-containing protein [bacterium]